MDKAEEWRAIDDAPDYAISNFGRVKRIKPDWQGKYLGRVLKPSPDHGGYLAVVLCTPEAKITRKIHRLVCSAFHGPPPSPQHHAAHRDGSRTNNVPRNLYWATAKENMADCIRHGTIARGDKSGRALHPERYPRGDDHWTRQHPTRVVRGDAHYRRLHPETVPRGEAQNGSKLTEDQAREIFETPHYRGSGKMLAEKFGVSMGLIGHIRNGRAWRHLGDPER